MHKRIYSTINTKWPSSKIREVFINYFKINDHKFIPSSSVNSRKDDGTYFVNAGMNQFKPLFLGTASVDYKRAVNSQKCIRIGGKHNDLEEVGKDHYHHTFFEMLGNWSFNEYFKKEACSYAWDLLTNVYHLDPSQLYVTYFQGLASLGIEEDKECFEIWKDIGVPESHIIKQAYNDNFWLMGDTGPCGPCTEIHYSQVKENALHLVNTGSGDVMEIWNIVFMQYDKQLDGSVNKLATSNIDTGMGLERLSAILQKKISNYDTDLFLPLLLHIQNYSGCRAYSGELNNAVDSAYRIIADHARMFTVAISDGLLPGRKDSENKLRSIIYRCIHESIEILKSKPGLSQSLVPVVASILGDSYPEIYLRKLEVQSIVGETEERYFKSIKMARKLMKKVMSYYNSPKELNAQQVLEIQEGKFGGGVSLDVISLLAKDLQIELPSEDAISQLVQNQNKSIVNHVSISSKAAFTKKDADLLASKYLHPTDNSHKYDFKFNGSTYEFTNLTAKIIAIRNKDGTYIENLPCFNDGELHSILFDKSNFYVEFGGQVSDCGVIKSKSVDTVISDILRVSSIDGYVLHDINNIQSPINVGDEVVLTIDPNHRSGCMRAHTATHILNFCLNNVLSHVRQCGSRVMPNQLTFEFLCSKASVSIKELQKISSLANEIVDKNLDVSRNLMQIDDAMCIKNLTYLPDEIYPKTVSVVSISSYLSDGCNTSVELCAGTHVANTGHIEAIVITNFEGSIQGSKKIVAVTGELARKALRNAEKVQSLLNKALTLRKDFTSSEELIKQINNALSGGMLLPKLFREKVLEELQTLASVQSTTRNKIKSSKLEMILKSALETSDDYIISIPFDKNRDMLELLVKLSPKYPIFVVSSKSSQNDTIFGLAYVPREILNMSVTLWMDNVCQLFPNAIYSPPKAKFFKHRNICVFSIPSKHSSIDVDLILKRAKEFKTVYLKENMLKIR